MKANLDALGAALDRRALLMLGAHAGLGAALMPRLALAATQPELMPRVRAVVERWVGPGKFPGLVASLGAPGRDPEFVARGTEGFTDADAVGPDSLFRIYSMTKPITGVAMMMLFEEGKWRLDDPVTRYIPELAKLQVFLGENPDGTMKLEDARRPITMRELMTHSGGLGYILNPNAPVDKLFLKEGVLNAAAPLQTMIDKLAKMPLLSQPGTRWQYSIAVDVQGYLVEKLSGQPFADFLRTRLFDPLGMKDTGFALLPDRASRIAPLYRRAQNGLEKLPDQNGLSSATYFSGAGGLVTTAEDYAQFATMLVNGGELNGKRFLSPRTIELMASNHTGEMAGGQMGMSPRGIGFGLTHPEDKPQVAATLRGLVQAGHYPQALWEA